MRYLVGLYIPTMTGDEFPVDRITEPFMVVDANSKDEAEEIYNKRTNANYFYGEVVSVINSHEDLCKIFRVSITDNLEGIDKEIADIIFDVMNSNTSNNKVYCISDTGKINRYSIKLINYE